MQDWVSAANNMLPMARHSAAQHSTAQHSTAQHSTAQHSRGQQQTNADLQKLAKACDNTTADELRNIHARGPDGSRISAPDAVDPLHGEHPGPTQVPPHPRDLHLGVIAEVPVEVLQVNTTILQSCQVSSHNIKEIQS